MIQWCCGNWASGLGFIEKALLLSPLSPHYSQFILTMDAYRRDDLAEAIKIAERIQAPNFYWTHLLRAIVYAGAGMVEKARSSFAKVRELYPECADAPEAELRKWFKVDAVVEQCLMSLREAGLR